MFSEKYMERDITTPSPIHFFCNFLSDYWRTSRQQVLVDKHIWLTTRFILLTYQSAGQDKIRELKLLLAVSPCSCISRDQWLAAKQLLVIEKKFWNNTRLKKVSSLKVQFRIYSWKNLKSDIPQTFKILNFCGCLYWQWKSINHKTKNISPRKVIKHSGPKNQAVTQH